jgi:hypothetical protein
MNFDQGGPDTFFVFGYWMVFFDYFQGRKSHGQNFF